MTAPGQTTKNVYKAAVEYQFKVLTGDREAEADLVRMYGAGWRRIKDKLDKLVSQIEAAQQKGEEFSPSWLFQKDRLVSLQAQVLEEMARFAKDAERVITEKQEWASYLAVEQLNEMLERAGWPPSEGITTSFSTLSMMTTRFLIGATAQGSPLRDLLDKLGPEASRNIREALVGGLIAGQHPSVIAREIRKDFGGNLARALTVARTEILRAYRETTRLALLTQNVANGWIWHSALGTRTCAFCWSMHGTRHPATERMATHPRCRCAMVPDVKPWSEMGIDVQGSVLEVPSGEELFKALDPDAQRKVLGPKLFELYKDGKITLAHVRGFRDDPLWGPVGYKRSVSAILRDLERPTTGSVLLAPEETVKKGAGKASLEPLSWKPMTADEVFDASMDAMDKLFPTLEDRAEEAAKKIASRIDWDRFDPAELSEAYISYRGPQDREKLVHHLLKVWESVSTQNSSQLMAVQLAAKEEFKLTAKTDHFDPDLFEDAKYRYERGGKVYRAVLRAMYDVTQETLAAAGVDEVVLFRGEVTRRPQDGKVSSSVDRIVLQPLSSFSARFQTAMSFASFERERVGRVYAVRVPRSRIIGVHGSGFGTTYEFEVVVLGSAEEDVARVVEFDQDVIRSNDDVFKRIGGKP